MKKFLVVSLVLNGALAAVLLWNGQAVHAVGVPVGNGDVNGDGATDISDATYLLNFLFLGGPAVKPIECPPPTGGLPDTRQTKGYDQRGTEIPCDSEMCQGQDGCY